MIPLVLCDKCHFPMTAVRPGKWQCDCETAGMLSEKDYEIYEKMDSVCFRVWKERHCPELGRDGDLDDDQTIDLIVACAIAVRAECQAEMERKQREWVTAGINWMGKLHQTGWNDWDVDQAILSQTGKGETK